jgi:hypothetical protein
MPELPMAVTSHPIGGRQASAVLDKADALLESVIDGLTRQ